MAYNGSGTFERPVAPYVFDTVISETDMNTEMDGIATGLTNAVTRDGQSPALANLPMGSYLHTNVGAATGQTNYARADQVQKGTFNYLTSVGGTADAITATAAISMSSYTTGQLFWLLPGSSNTAVDPTLNVNAIGAGTITKFGGGALVAGDIRQNWPAVLQRTASGFELLNPYTVAAGQMQANSVSTAAIQDSAVPTEKINDKAVTLPKMADLAASKLIGRATASTGVPEAVGLGNGLEMDPSATALRVPANKNPIQGSVKALKIVSADAGTSSIVTADAVTLEDTDGFSRRFQTVSETINLSASGANGLDTGTVAAATWYYLWLIGKTDGTIDGLASASSTAPTMPSGYTFKALIGAVRTKTGSAVILGSIQYGRTVQFTLPRELTTGAQGTAGSAFATVAIGDFVPTSVASRIYVRSWIREGRCPRLPPRWRLTRLECSQP